MTTVEKIGGTSMSRFGEVLDNIMLRDPNRVYGRVYVVSAYGGVTNRLLEHKKTGEPGIYALLANGGQYRTALEQLLAELQRKNAELEPLGLKLSQADAFIEQRLSELADYLDSMRHVLASGYVQRDNVLLAAREMLAATGEAHSAYNSAAILQAKGHRSELVDLTGFDDDEALTLDERIERAFRAVDPEKCIPVVTGYTKGTEGIMREFDRGYSEVTFSKVAVELRASEALIHKEFHLSSADPAIVGADNTVIVGNTNFDVADQLADVGMEAIHPKAAKPIELAGIPIRLKNTFEPDHPGTLITNDYVGRHARIEVIAGSTTVTLLEIHDPSMVGAVGFDLDLLEILRRHRVSYIMKATNAIAITHVVWEKALTRELVQEIQQAYDHVSTSPVAIVCVIGTNMRTPGVLARAVSVLAEEKINVRCVSQSSRQVNMQFVIEREDYERAIRALNLALCVNGSPR